MSFGFCVVVVFQFYLQSIRLRGNWGRRDEGMTEGRRPGQSGVIPSGLFIQSRFSPGHKLWFGLYYYYYHFACKAHNGLQSQFPLWNNSTVKLIWRTTYFIRVVNNFRKFGKLMNATRFRVIILELWRLSAKFGSFVTNE